MRETSKARAILAMAAGVGILLAASTARAQAPEQFKVWGDKAADHAYLVDPKLDSPGDAKIVATDADTKQGFALFARSFAAPLGGKFVPQESDRIAKLAAADCAGEYGPMSFVIWALDKGEFTVSVSALSDGKNAIARENLDVRVVRMIADKKGDVFPVMLESFTKAPLEANRFAQIWITYHVPKGTPAGTYKGSVTVSGLKGKAELPIELQVYPFTLSPSERSLYIYGPQSSNKKDKDATLARLIDQRCHGMNNGMLPVPTNAKGEVNAAELPAWVELYKKAGFDHHYTHLGLWNRITANWTAMNKSKGMNCDWFLYHPFSKELDDKYVANVKLVNDALKAKGLELIISVADESGSHPWTTEATQHYNKLLKERLPEVTRDLTTGGGWAMKRPEHELWKGQINIWVMNRWFPEYIAQVRKDDPKAKFEIYNMGGGGSMNGGLEACRAVYGYFLWKTKVSGCAQWVYWHKATPAHMYIWPAADGKPVPTLRWELSREGVKDLKYIEKLESLLKTAKGPAADSARKLLADIDGKIKLEHQNYDVIDGGRIKTQPPGTYDAWRASIAKAIMQLQK